MVLITGINRRTVLNGLGPPFRGAPHEKSLAVDRREALSIHKRGAILISAVECRECAIHRHSKQRNN